MGLVEDITEQAAELRRAPDDTYEVAVGIALTAAHYCPGGWHFDETDSAVGAVAASVRDLFGTWAQRIHTYGHVNGSTETEALDAHRSIEMAVNEWLGSGRLDPRAFVARWLSVVGLVDTTWLREGRAPDAGG